MALTLTRPSRGRKNREINICNFQPSFPEKNKNSHKMSSSSSSSIIFSLLLLYAAAVLISCATIGKNTIDAADDDKAMEKQFDNLLRLLIDCVKMLKDGQDPAHVQKIVLLEMEATKDTQTRLNDYLYKRMDTNKVGLNK
jgi:hypothetical protein